MDTRKTSTSTTISRLAQVAQKYTELSSEEMEEFQALNHLNRTLSTTSKLSTSSSFADRMNASRYQNSKFGDIGVGSCGQIWEIPGTEIAIKTSTMTKALWTDYHLTNRAHRAFQGVETIQRLQQVCSMFELTPPRIPRADGLFLSTDENGQTWWKENSRKFPRDSAPLEHSTAFKILKIKTAYFVSTSVKKSLYLMKRKNGATLYEISNLRSILLMTWTST